MRKKDYLHYYIGSSDASGSVRQGTLSIIPLTVALLFLGTLIVLSVVGLYFSIQSTLYYSQVRQSQKITAHLISETENISSDLSFLDETLDTLFQQEDNLRLKYGLPIVNRDVRLSGIGGAPSLTLMTSQLLATPRLKEISRLNEELNRVHRQISLTTTSISNTLKFNKTRELYYTDLPATSPVGGRVASPFGVRFHPVLGMQKMHDGLDLANPKWTPIKAPANGVVVYEGVRGAYGNIVVLKHLETGLETRYAHMVAIAVERGQEVQRGSVIGYVGNTGRSTGPHLHYEVREFNRPVNPKRFLPDSLIVME